MKVPGTVNHVLIKGQLTGFPGSPGFPENPISPGRPLIKEREGI